MKRVYVSETMERGVWVEVSEDGLRELQDPQHPNYHTMRTLVLTQAAEQMPSAEISWVSTDVFDEQDNALFDVS